MSVTIQIADDQAVLADGEWRSTDEGLRELLNAHLVASQFEVGAHVPPHDRELELACLACEAFAGSIIDSRPDATDRCARLTAGKSCSESVRSAGETLNGCRFSK